jgi:site-specific DNA-methyltransferase (adenine-specific)
MLELNKIYNMDCVKGMQLMDDNSVDCIITDPPYGIDYQSARRIDTQRFDKIEGDKLPHIWWLNEGYRVLKDGGTLLCFCRWDVQEIFMKAIECAGFYVKNQVIWDRIIHGLGDLKGSFAPTYDIILFAVKGKFEFINGRPKDVLRFVRVSPDKLLHPNEKPIELIKYLVGILTNKKNIVLDCFVGCGTTSVACKYMERNFIGFEISKEYCDIANNRLKQKVFTDFNSFAKK